MIISPLLSCDFSLILSDFRVRNASQCQNILDRIKDIEAPLGHAHSRAGSCMEEVHFYTHSHALSTPSCPTIFGCKAINARIKGGVQVQSWSICLHSWKMSTMNPWGPLAAPRGAPYIHGNQWTEPPQQYFPRAQPCRRHTHARERGGTHRSILMGILWTTFPTTTSYWCAICIFFPEWGHA